MEGGNNLEQAVALVAAANRVVQDPNSVGSALRTISLRLRGTSVEVLEEMGEETDGVVESVSKLQSKIKALSGVNILTDAGAYKDTYTILKEIGNVWEKMSDMDQAALLELMAGKNRANTLSAILSNMEDLEGAYESAMNAEGSALKENEAYLDSIQGKIDQFTNALQTFWNNLLNSEMLKKFIEAGTAILEFFNKLGPELTILMGVIGGISGATFLKGLNAWFKDNSKSASLVKELTKSFGKLKGGIGAVGGALKGLGVGVPVFGAIAAAVATVVIGLRNAREEAAQTANTYAQQINEENSALKKYKEEAEKLRTELDSGNLSEAEAYDARKRLIEIQGELVDMFGKEAEGINLVTGAIKEQTAAIDALAVSNAQKWLTENSRAVKFLGIGKKSVIDSAKEYMTSDTNVSVMHAGKGGFKDSFKEAYGDDWESYYNDALVQFEKYIESLGGYTGEENFSLWGMTREEVLEKASQITQWLEDYAKSTKNKVDFSDFIGLINTDIGSQIDASAYDTHKQNWEAYLENTALTTYTKEYGNILNAQQELEDAITSGDKSLILAASEKLTGAVEAAKTAAGEDEWQVKWFDDLDDQYAAAVNAINFKDAWGSNTDEIASSIKTALSIANEKVGHDLTDDELLSMTDLVSKDYDWSTYQPDAVNHNAIWGTRADEYSKEEKNAYELIASAAAKYGLTVDEVIDSLVQLGVIQGSVFSGEEEKISAKSKSLSILTESVEKYNETQLMSAEIVSDNIEISEEQYNMLRELIGSEEEFAECIDTTNGYVVTNSDLLNDLVKSSKKNIANNAKLAKSQARLKYYDLYKQMRSLTKGQNKLTGAALEEVEALYGQMNAIEKTIAKYSMLETKLLGVTNAFTDLENAQAADEAMDYGSKAEEMAGALANAFSTAELGTEAAQVAFEGLIPDDVLDKTKTLDEQMAQAYSYFTEGQLSKLFKIEFDDEGAVESVEMTKESIETFTKSLIGSAEDGAVFQGTWDEFTLNPAITSLEKFAEACGLTEEVAFAFLTSLEKYDISWLGNDFSTLLDQLMGDDLDYQYYDKMQKLADLEMKIAQGTITKEEQSTYGTLLGEMDALEEQAVNNTIRYAALSEQLDETKQRMTELNEELEDGTSGRSKDEITADLEAAQEEATNLLKLIEKIDEPTEFTLQLAADEIQEQIDNFKKDLEKSGNITLQGVIAEIDSKGIEELGLTQAEGGTWEGLANIEGYSNLDPASKAEVVEYLSLINSQHTIDALMGDGITTIEGHLENIAAILQKTYDLMVDTEEAENNVVTFKDLWDSIKSKEVTLTQKLQTIGEFVSQFFANGTAHASGTAHAHGNWGAPRTETALVGELGPEMVVRGNRWFTVGDNGAEFANIKKGDIVFNHKQTEDLLSKGYVVGRGKSYASGTAYNGINTYNGSTPTDPVGGDNNDDSSKDAEQLIDFIEIKLEEIENTISKSTAKLENVIDNASTIVEKNNLYDELIEAQKDKANVNQQAVEKYMNHAATLLAEIPAEYHAMAKDGAIDIRNFLGEEQVEIAEAIEEYREWDAKADEAEIAKLEAIAEISALRLQQIQDIADDFDNVISLTDAKSSLLQSHMDLVEESGNRLSSEYYDELIKDATEKISTLEEKHTAMRNTLREAVAAGEIKVGSDDWYEAANAIMEVDEQIVQCRTDTEKWNNAIQELKWDNLNKFTTELGNVESQLSHFYDLLSDDADVVDEFGNWTDEGYASLGLLAQKMELAQYNAEQYAQAIRDLDEDYKNGKYSTDEYNEKIAELQENQWDSIEAYEQTKDEIVALNKVRVEAVKKGMKEEIDAYKELIDLKKESLNEDKEAREFADNVAEKEKKVEQIERQLAAIRNNTSAEATAKRKQLQAELLEARSELEDFYYDHSIQVQEDALDKEYEAYEKNKQDEMDKLDEWLKDTERVVAESTKLVQENAEAVLSTLQDTVTTYGIEISDIISDAVVSPWEDGASAITNYATTFGAVADSFIEKLGAIKTAQQELIDQASTQAGQTIASVNTSVSLNTGKTIEDYSKDYFAARENLDAAGMKAANDAANQIRAEMGVEQQVAYSDIPYIQGLADELAQCKQIWAETEAAYKAGEISAQEAYDAMKAANDRANEIRQEVGADVQDASGKLNEIKQSIPHHAKGTLGTKRSGLSWVDEMGLEEIVMHAGPDGRLQYLSKGSAVIPHDISENLIKLGQLDPSQVLEQSKVTLGAPNITTNNMEINLQISEVVHVDHADSNSIPDIARAVQSQMDKYMQNINTSLKKKVR